MRYTLSLLLAFLVAAASVDAYAQSFPANDGSKDPQSDQTDVVPGEILVKFKDGVQVVPSKRGGLEVSAPAVDSVFQDVRVTSSKALFPNAEPQAKKAPQEFETYTGQTIERPSLHNIYKFSIEDPARQSGVIRQLKQQETVVYAEPNYIYQILDSPSPPGRSSSEMKSLGETRDVKTTSPSLPPDDPLYGEQHHITATNINDVWADTTGSSEHVIAILDTGVDMDHPDLTNKIWTNTAEANGAEGVDDDGNGYVDDVHGWDYINNDADPADDNSHGTHVAGIAAAEANNGIGIAGVNWRARIMPIKILQSSGRGDVATIVQGIQYADQMGADVLNMSFGSYARSLTMENALAEAYADAFLVGAAGNDGTCIGPGPGCAPFFPAALTYILGVEASNEGGGLAGFSNFDQDGPVFSRYDELWNYEVRTPGIGIQSSIPGGNYRSYSGTSMSAPVISGAVSLYHSLFPGQSQEEVWGNLIQTRAGHIDLAAATDVQPEPDLRFVTRTLVDTLENGDEDGNVDAGEKIELWFEALNAWGQADSVAVKLDFGEFEDPSVGTIQKDSAFIGSISSYARRTNQDSPLKIEVDPGVSHDRDVVFSAKLFNIGSQDTTKKEFVLNIDNGRELYGVLDSTRTLSQSNLWLVTNSFKVGSNGTLNIEPGTKIEIDQGLDIKVEGNVYALGNEENPIIVRGPGQGFILDGNNPGTNRVFVNVHFKYMGTPIGLSSTAYQRNAITKNSKFIETGCFRGFDKFINNVVRSVSCDRIISYISGTFKYNNYYNMNGNFNFGQSTITSIDTFMYNNFVKMNGVGTFREDAENDQTKNNFISGKGSEIVSTYYQTDADIVAVGEQYWGTTDSLKITDSKIYDFWDSNNLPLADFSDKMSSPSDSAHGVVWKVEVNGTDPRMDEMGPIGVGPVRYDVFFNRPMDTQYEPQLSFGVRHPYTQNIVTDSSQWSADSTQWTAYATVDLNTGDGINRIRVDDARDPEGFKIPVEDQRFEFVIDAAGSVSQDFVADAGLGQVDLNWTPPEEENLLGYNVYRFENQTDSTYTDTTRINEELVTDTTYTDYNVQPDSNYYYQYTVVNTDLSESNKSQVAAAEVLTADPGDANGDQSVDVLDVTTTTAHILDQGPNPFIFDAADVNDDATVNILDVVGIVDLVLGGSQSEKTLADATATLQKENGRLILDATSAVGGVQLSLSGVENGEVRALEVPEGIEVSRAATVGDTLSVLMYGMGGTTIPAGEQPLLSVGDSASIGSAVVSDPSGNAIQTVIPSAQKDLPEEFVLEANYPNPVQQSTTIPYKLKTDVAQVSVTVYDILGRRVATLRPENRMAGRHELQFRANRLASGVYFYRMSVTTPDGSRRQVGTNKMVVVR